MSAVSASSPSSGLPVEPPDLPRRRATIVFVDDPPAAPSAQLNDSDTVAPSALLRIGEVEASADHELGLVCALLDGAHWLPATARPPRISSGDTGERTLGLFLPGDHHRRSEIRLQDGHAAAWMLLHELGHWLDFEVLGVLARPPASVRSPLLERWHEAAERSAAYTAWHRTMAASWDVEQVTFLRYLLRPEELFARADAQWALARLGGGRWASQLHAADESLLDILPTIEAGDP